MDRFVLNNRTWNIIIVNPYSDYLIDRTGRRTVATTDPATNNVYMSSELSGDFFVRVLIHEMGHCTLVSYGLLDTIRRMVKPYYWIEAEEWICNFIADYGMLIFNTARNVMEYSAIRIVPYELDRMIA